MDDWDWNVVRFELFNALDSLKVHDIFLVEKEENVVTVSFIVEDMGNLKSLTRMRIIDKLIEDKAPDLYRQYMFVYEIWSKDEWDQMPVKKFFDRWASFPRD